MSSHAKKLIVSISIVAIFGVLPSVKAQSNTTVKSLESAKRQVEGRQGNQSESLPYNAVPVAEYLDKLIAAAEVKPRGEFETKEVYEARVSQKVVHQPAFVLVDSGGTESYFYSVDEKLLELYVPGIGSLTPRKNLTGTPLKVGTRTRGGDSYNASNAYGATVLVDRSYVTRYVIYVMQPDLHKIIDQYLKPDARRRGSALSEDLKKYYIDFGLVIKLNVEPVEAQKLVAENQIFMKIAPDGIVNSEATSTTKPTVKDPAETTLFTKAAQVKVEEIIVRNKMTGMEIFKKTFE